MLHGKIETRTWYTKYRGLVLICASLKPYSNSELLDISGKEQTDRIFTTLGIEGANEAPGHAIAVGDLVDCRGMREDDQDKCFVSFFASGLYCHVYQNVKPIKPFPWKGTQGWKILDQETIDKIEYL